MHHRSSLTTAELRLVPFLATRLTVRGIGERLYLSQNTVKTQTLSIYRKLGASTRADAVDRMQRLGPPESKPARGRRNTSTQSRCRPASVRPSKRLECCTSLGLLG